MTERLHRIVSSYWPVMCGLILFATAWGTLNANNSALKDMVAQMLVKQDKSADQIASLQASIASMQAAANINAAVITDFRERLRAVEARR